MSRRMRIARRATVVIAGLGIAIDMATMLIAGLVANAEVRPHARQTSCVRYAYECEYRQLRTEIMHGKMITFGVLKYRAYEYAPPPWILEFTKAPAAFDRKHHLSGPCIEAGTGTGKSGSTVSEAVLCRNGTGARVN